MRGGCKLPKHLQPGFRIAPERHTFRTECGNPDLVGIADLTSHSDVEPDTAIRKPPPGEYYFARMHQRWHDGRVAAATLGLNAAGSAPTESTLKGGHHIHHGSTRILLGRYLHCPITGWKSM
jgi:hypothetical protein